VRIIRALLLDFGGTLDSDGKHWSTQLAESFTASGMQLDRAVLDRAFLAADRAINRDPEAAGMALPAYARAYAEHMLAMLGLPAAPSADRIARAFLERAREHLAASSLLLRPLRAQVRLAVISNFTANLPSILQEVGLASLLDTVVCSAIEGVRKPDPSIFHLTLARLGVQPGEAAMIGDSLGNDIEPAKQLGLVTVWLAGDRNYAGGAEAAADHVVPTLAQALATLRQHAELVR
jgi:HAD superfamily hydrolase (TIGR01509 family)